MSWLFKISIANLKKRKSRTFLTILGIVIGVISVVSMISIGFGATKTIMADLEKEGNSKAITVSAPNGGSNRKDRILNDKTLENFKKLNGVEKAYPVIELSMDEKMDQYRGWVQVAGVPAEELEAITLVDGQIERGNANKIVCISGGASGYGFYDENTGNSFTDMNGKEATLTGKRISVQYDSADVSMYALSDEEATDIESSVSEETRYVESRILISGTNDNEYDFGFYTNIDDLKTFIRTNGYASNNWSYSQIVIIADSLKSVDDISTTIKNMGYQVENNKEAVAMFTKITKSMNIMLAVIGSIAFAVAVIGIINTMTTAVYDRMKEIGVMKMIGCDSDDIMLMFLIESGLLGLIGGVIGVFISFLVNHYIVNRIVVKMLDFAEGTVLATLPIWLALGAVLFAIVIAVLAGVIPARWASKMKPLEAATNV